MSGVKNQKWSAYKVKRRKVLRFMVALYNRKKHEAVFKEDDEELEGLQETIELLKSIDYDNSTWSYKGVCPICGSDKIIYCPIEPCCFDDRSKLYKGKLGKIEGLIINHCTDCGFTNIENPFADYNNKW